MLPPCFSALTCRLLQTSERDLKDEFARYGKLVDVYIPRSEKKKKKKVPADSYFFLFSLSFTVSRRACSPAALAL
jgi:hypothetical protein